MEYSEVWNSINCITRRLDKRKTKYCLFQLALFSNEDFNIIEQKVSIELGVGDSDLNLDQTRPQDMIVTGISNHVVLLASQRSLVLQQSELMESHKEKRVNSAGN